MKKILMSACLLAVSAGLHAETESTPTSTTDKSGVYCYYAGNEFSIGALLKQVDTLMICAKEGQKVRWVKYK